MSSQVSPLEVVHTGLWRDHAQGQAAALTLTVTTTTGTYFIAFLAIFVRLAAGHFWDICCYIWFHLAATDKPKDGLYHQQQALLRNNLSDSRALWQFTTTAWAWRKRTNHPLLRSLPLIVAALLHFVAFTIAGIFSAKVTNIQSHVLIHGPTCGPWTSKLPHDQAGMIEVAESWSWRDSIWRTSEIQSSSCHAFNTTGTTQNLRDCRAWGREFVPFTLNTSVPCPFAKEMCLNDLAVQIESGLVDSTKHLGINGPTKDRIQFRHRMQCAPIKTEGFTHIPKNGTTGHAVGYFNPQWGPQELIGYAYGPQIADFNGSDYTFVWNNETFGDVTTSDINTATFGIDTEVAFAPNRENLGNSTFDPIPQMSRPDADVSMFFIEPHLIRYAVPINDPIFSATVPIEDPMPVDGQEIPIYYYTPAQPVGLIACASQYQFCEPNGQKTCTDWNGYYNLYPETELNLNERQLGVLDRVRVALGAARVFEMVVALGQESLLALTAVMWGPAGSYLPDDQWIMELDHWASMYYNSVQLHIAQYAVGNGKPAQDRYRVAPAPVDDWMCNAQVVQRGDYSSFNMAGVLVILCFGLFFVIVNTSMDSITECIKKRRAAKAGQDWTSRWRSHGLLHLQSAALDAAGYGEWDHEGRVPTTTSNRKFHFPLWRGKASLAGSESDGPEFVYESKVPIVSEQPRDAEAAYAPPNIQPDSQPDSDANRFSFVYESKLPNEDSISLPSSVATGGPESAGGTQPHPEKKRWTSKFSKPGSGLAGQGSSHNLIQ